MSDSVADWLAARDPATHATIEALRAIVSRAAPDLVEEINWNAPSFRDGDEHRLTLGLERRGGVRIVLHRGVAAKDATRFAFADPDRLMRWASPDRGIAVFVDAEAVITAGPALGALVARWVAATRHGR